jgi:hypothetical protein
MPQSLISKRIVDSNLVTTAENYEPRIARLVAHRTQASVTSRNPRLRNQNSHVTARQEPSE